MREIEPSEVSYEFFFYLENDYLQIVPFVHTPQVQKKQNRLLSITLTLFVNRNLAF